MAPEVLLRQNHSFCVDYYAVGIIAYELVLEKDLILEDNENKLEIKC